MSLITARSQRPLLWASLSPLSLEPYSSVPANHTLWSIHEYLVSNDYTQNRKLKCFLMQTHIFLGGWEWVELCPCFLGFLIKPSGKNSRHRHEKTTDCIVGCAGNVGLEKKRNSSNFIDQTQLIFERGSCIWQALANSS